MNSEKIVKYIKEDFLSSVMLLAKQCLAQFFNSTWFLLGLTVVFCFLEFEVTIVYKQIFNQTLDLTKIFPFFFFIVYTLCCFFLLPAMTTKYIFREKLSDMGLAIPKNKIMMIILSLLAAAILLPCICYFSTLKSFQTYYSFGNISIVKFIFINIVFIPWYYFAEEFFIRGFLFLSLWRKVKWHSFWITEIIFALGHLGKPGLEILLCIPASIVLNYLVLKTRSIYPPMMVHYSIGVLMNVLVNYKL